MNYLMLLMVTLGVSVQQIVTKAYNNKVSGGVYSFAGASAFMALIVFLITSGGNFNFRSDLLIYSILFAISYCAATVCSILAIKTGSLSLTSLVIQYSLIIPTVVGFVALDEPIKPALFVGVILLLISLVFINLKKEEKKKKLTLGWGFFAFFAFAGNGVCSVIQKVQQLEFDGMYKSELMIIALIITVVVLFTLAIFTEKKSFVHNIKAGTWCFTVRGLANGIVNFLVLTLSNLMPASVMFPVISAGGILITALVSVFGYKEKLLTQQKIGIVLGLLSIIALNI